jgi:hypothetical protein
MTGAFLLAVVLDVDSPLWFIFPAALQYSKWLSSTMDDEAKLFVLSVLVVDVVVGAAVENAPTVRVDARKIMIMDGHHSTRIEEVAS